MSIIWRYHIKACLVKGLVRTAYQPGIGAGRPGPGAVQLPLQPWRGQLVDDALLTLRKPAVTENEHPEAY
jgi:hypothetical protein